MKHSENPQLSLVLPCYNEALSLRELVLKLEQVFENQNVEVLLVNNGSTDDSQQILEDLKQKKPWLSILQLHQNQGYGHGIQQGLKAARGEYVGWAHADLQTDPADALEGFLRLMKTPSPKKTFIKGQRQKRPWVDRFFTFGMSVFESLYFGMWLWDINAQPNLFHRGLLEQLDEPPKDFSFDLYVLIMAQKIGFECHRFPVQFPKRLHGTSSWNTGLQARLKFIRRTLKFSVELKQRLNACCKA